MIILQFSRDTTLGGTYYEGGFQQSLFLDTDVTLTDILIADVPLRRRMEKRRTLVVTACPEYMTDCLNLLPAMQLVSITDSAGRVVQCDDVEVATEWLDECYAEVKVTFTVKKMDLTKC